MVFDCEPSPFRNGIRYVCGDGARLGEIALERGAYVFHFHAWADRLSAADKKKLREFANQQVLLANITLRLTR